MSQGRLGASVRGLALTFVLCAAACAASEESDDNPNRPSGAGATGGSGATTGSGGSSGSFVDSGGSGGVGGSNGSDGSGGLGGSGGSSGSGGSGASGGSSDSGSGAGGSGGSPPDCAGYAFCDDFEQSAGQWVSAPPDGWSIVLDDTNVYQQGTLDTELRVSAAGIVSWTDQTIEARVKVLAFTGSSSGYQASVFARFKDLRNHYYVALQSNGEMKIKKSVDGSNSSLTSKAPTPIALNTWYSVKFEVTGPTLVAYLDGAEVLRTTDAEITSGGVALGTKNATAQFDDVKVTLPP